MVALFFFFFKVDRTTWSNWSPDLTPPVFFLLGVLKDVVYRFELKTIPVLKQAIGDQFSEINVVMCQIVCSKTDLLFKQLLLKNSCLGMGGLLKGCFLDRSNFSLFKSKVNRYSRILRFLPLALTLRQQSHSVKPLPWEALGEQLISTCMSSIEKSKKQKPVSRRYCFILEQTTLQEIYNHMQDVYHECHHSHSSMLNQRQWEE